MMNDLFTGYSFASVLYGIVRKHIINGKGGSKRQFSKRTHCITLLQTFMIHNFSHNYDVKIEPSLFIGLSSISSSLTFLIENLNIDNQMWGNVTTHKELKFHVPPKPVDFWLML